MKKAILFLIIFFLAGLAAFSSLIRKSAAPVSESGDGADVLSGEENPSESPALPHAVSLAALMERAWDGRDFRLGDVLAETPAYTRRAITYRSGDLRISGIMNVPKGSGPFPVLVLNHGYIDPAVYTTGRGLRREQDYLARRGFVVIHPDYRNHASSDKDPDAELSLRLGYVEDVVNAIVALRKADLDFVDEERIGMMGHSMGGGIAQAVAVTAPDLVDAFVLYAPVSGVAWENYERYTSRRPEEAARVIAAYRTILESPDFWAGASSATHYDRVQAPVMIHIGTRDESTPPAWSFAIEERLKALGKEVTLHVYEGERHEFGPEWESMMERTAAFFSEHLAGR